MKIRKIYISIIVLILLLNCRSNHNQIDDFSYIGLISPNKENFDVNSCGKRITETKVSVLPPNDYQRANSFIGTTQAIIKIICGDRTFEIKMKYHSIGLDDELISISNGKYKQDIYKYKVDSPGSGSLEFIGANLSDIYFSISEFNVLGLIIGDELVRPVYRLSIEDFSLHLLK
ncbi:hypothetical protein V6Z05_19805 [Leptospira venezuelensis]|uniref:hypothetical protein n=1 Tax=Leptospira venezuelensis TaxID=1958811 RepID=UPI000A3A40A0|nr:hypothetical protein [Leptospira venezuelensis]